MELQLCLLFVFNKFEKSVQIADYMFDFFFIYDFNLVSLKNLKIQQCLNGIIEKVLRRSLPLLETTFFFSICSE